MTIIQIAFTYLWNHKLNSNKQQERKIACTWVAKEWSNSALDQRCSNLALFNHLRKRKKTKKQHHEALHQKNKNNC